MRLLAQSSPGCAFEKASIDEAYLDITTLAVGLLNSRVGGLPCTRRAASRTNESRCVATAPTEPSLSLGAHRCLLVSSLAGLQPIIVCAAALCVAGAGVVPG